MSADPVLRPPVLHRLRVATATDSPLLGAGPWRIRLAVTCGDRAVAEQALLIQDAEALALGITLVVPILVTEPLAGPAPANLTVSVSGANGVIQQRGSATAATPGSLTAELAAHQAALGADPSPLAALLLDQAAEGLVVGAAWTQVRDLLDLLATGIPAQGWRDEGGGRRLLAFRDPADGSAQPVRLHLPSQPRGTALLCHGGAAPGKLDWPAPPAAIIAAALAQGWAVVEVHPASDGQWSSLAPRRALLALAAARAAGAPAGPVLVVGIGNGAGGALRVAMRLNQATAVRLDQPRLLDLLQSPILAAALTGIDLGAHGRLALPTGLVATSLPAPTEAGFWAPALTRLRQVALRVEAGPATVTDGPFTIVVGTREHTAAVGDARRLAQQLSDAWARFAMGRPRMVDDTATSLRAEAGRHLVLVGNPRSNALLATLVRRGLTLPLTWDDRAVRLDAKAYPRGELRPVVWSGPRPDDAALQLIVVDGAPTLPAGQLFAGWPDIGIGDGRGGWILPVDPLAPMLSRP